MTVATAAWPVAVGGLGGSGTRAVAELLRLAGLYIGSDLNEALDNRWFTLLFKRPAWYERARAAGGSPVQRAVGVFEGVMTRGRAAALRSMPFLVAAATDLARSGHDPTGFGRGTWPYRRVGSMLRATGPRPAEHVGWGWKEPNTHVFLPELANRLPSLRYVHVVRHGLDMAYSRNQNQLHNWGRLFGMEPAARAAPAASLEFWVRANERAVELGRQLLGPRFLVVNTDRLCDDPHAGVDDLVAFLGVDVAAPTLARMAEVPRRPGSSGRYREQDLSVFRPDQLEAVRRLGFAVEA